MDLPTRVSLSIGVHVDCTALGARGREHGAPTSVTVAVLYGALVGNAVSVERGGGERATRAG